MVYDGNTLLTTQPVLRTGCAIWAIAPALSVGTHQITVAYSGDKNNPAGVSAPATVIVDPAPVDLTLLCTPLLEYGSNSQCLVGALSLASPVQGNITYTYDSNAPVSVPLSHSGAQFNITRPDAGTHTVTVAFAAQGNYATASTRSQKFVVLPAPVRVTLTASSRSVKAGTSVALNAAISSSAGAPNATGNVTFRDGLTLLATVPVNASGQAAFSTSSLSAGVHVISATYANGTNFGAGLDTLVVTVTK